MNRFSFIVFALAMALAGCILCGCEKEEEHPNSGNEIMFAPAVNAGTGVKTRGASLYESEEYDLRGDRIHIDTYFTQRNHSPFFSSDAQFSNEDVDPSKHRWLFHNGSGYTTHYWPLEESVDFFAYAPGICSYISVDKSGGKFPPSFTATMPLNNSGTDQNQDNMKEFMYACTPNRTNEQGVVPLSFEHPFAAIVFTVKQSQRDLTVNSITISDIGYKSTCTPALDGGRYIPNWGSFEGTGDLVLTVGKIIPGEINFGGELGGPYLVLPQDNSSTNKTLNIVCHWKGYDTDNKTKTLTGIINNKWEAGKVYYYALDLGNSRQEILFEVTIKPWEYIFEHEFEIE